MYKTIEEGLEAFRQALKSYLYHLIIFERKEDDFSKVESQRLVGMEEALGLSRDEVSKIHKPISDELWKKKEEMERCGQLKRAD